MNRKADVKAAAKEVRPRTTKEPEITHAGLPHPRSVPITAPGNPADGDLEQPFAEGARDEIDPDLRHRMISEAAYALYVGRNYADDYALDDWLAAEATVDHLLLP